MIGNPGSTALRAALAAAGLAISDRDSRYLAKQMPLYYQGERKPNLWELCAAQDLIINN